MVFGSCTHQHRDGGANGCHFLGADPRQMTGSLGESGEDFNDNTE